MELAPKTPSHSLAPFPAAMATSAFRPPQFSEDLAWLPTWLQNPQIESSSNYMKETLNDSSPHLEAFLSEECRNNHFKLFLSGDSGAASQISVSPSPRNVVDFCLRLSVDGESQQSESHDLDMSRPLVQRVEDFADSSQERLYQSDAVDNIGPQHPTNKEEIEGQNGEKVYCSAGPSSHSNSKENVENEERFKDSDFSDAVELSIAASEALVMHELMCCGSTSEVVSRGAILEAALQVKQARLEALEDGKGCLSDKIDEIDDPSDLDDFNMENAFVDVGLSFSNADDPHACCSDPSQVEDTPVDSHHGHNNGFKHVQLRVHHDNNSNGSALGLNTSKIASPVDPILHQLTDRVPYVPAVAQTQADVNSSPACMSENGGEEKTCSSVADKFRSRWLGGWEMMKADASSGLKQRGGKGIPKIFNYETSFLSESAADENSIVQKCESGSKIASQSSVPFEGVLDKHDERTSCSQEFNQSLVDPLCSVVPCSISAENAATLLSPNQEDRGANSQHCFSTKSELRIDNSQKASDVNDAANVDKEAVPTNTSECLEGPVLRHWASLKTYSTLLPKHEALLKGQQVGQNQLLSSEYIVELISSNGSSGQRNSRPARSEFPCSIGVNHAQNQNISVSRSPVTHHDETTKYVAERQFLPSVLRGSPLVLNRRARCRLQPSVFLAGERNSEQVVAPGTVSKDLQRKEQKVKFKLENPCSTSNVSRKSVRFSEVEVGLHEEKGIRKPQTSQKNSSAIRANKRSKYSKLWTDNRTRDVNHCLTKHIDDVKRLIFHGLQFLLTGFSNRKEREIVKLIEEHGGVVLLDVPSPPSNYRAKRSARSDCQQPPIVIGSKKLQTTKFLYGCAVNAFILKVKWLAQSVAAGSVVSPEEYLILPNRAVVQCTRFRKLSHQDDTRRIFDRVGIMLHGKHSFCTKLTIIIKHGGGQVFRTLQRLFQNLDAQKISKGAIVTEDESKASRHLRHCALERKVPMMPAIWIVKSLHFGKLLPFGEEDDAPTIKAPVAATFLDWSEEI